MSIHSTSPRMPMSALLEKEAALDDIAVQAAAAARPASRGARKPHICFVAPSAWPIFSGDRDIPVVGGAEVQQSIIAPELAKRGFRVTMVTLDYGQDDATDVKGVTVRKLYRPDEGLPVVRFVYPRMTTLWRVLKEVDADIYYQRTSAALTGLMAAFCRRHGKKSVYSGASDVDFLPGKQEIGLARDRWLFEHGLRNVDRVFVQNVNQLEKAKANYGREGALIPNCYAPPADARPADPHGYVLWVASVKPQKRPEIFLEMARRLPQHRFVMIGGADASGRANDYAEAMREAAGKLPNVEYRGFLPFLEADRQFSGARVLVNTSLYEGFPNTFLQAWSRGVPSVAFVDTGSRHQGAPAYDVVRDVDEATARVARLMSDDVHWKGTSQRVLEHFREAHSPDAVLAQYEREFMAMCPSPIACEGRGGL
jgi:glycosyltransferase involved in cell wall biosynthesis